VSCLYKIRFVTVVLFCCTFFFFLLGFSPPLFRIWPPSTGFDVSFCLGVALGWTCYLFYMIPIAPPSVARLPGRSPWFMIGGVPPRMCSFSFLVSRESRWRCRSRWEFRALQNFGKRFSFSSSHRVTQSQPRFLPPRLSSSRRLICVGPRMGSAFFA